MCNRGNNCIRPPSRASRARSWHETRDTLPFGLDDDLVASMASYNSRCHTHKSLKSNLVQWPAAAISTFWNRIGSRRRH